MRIAHRDLALVTNRADNSISVLTIAGKDVKVTDTIAMGDSVAHVAISAVERPGAEAVNWRRIATRYDKLARNFLAATTLVGVLYWIKL